MHCLCIFLTHIFVVIQMESSVVFIAHTRGQVRQWGKHAIMLLMIGTSFSAGKSRDLGQFRRFNYRKHVVAITVNWRTAKNLSNGEKNIPNNRFFRCFRSFRVYEALASIVILSNGICYRNCDCILFQTFRLYFWWPKVFTTSWRPNWGQNYDGRGPFGYAKLEG